MPFQVIAANINEKIEADENPQDYVTRLARSKALAILPQAAQRNVVIAADTAVVDGDDVLGKPADPLEAFDMLRALRGHSHHVFTSLAVRNTLTGNQLSDVCVTEVSMRAYSEAEISEYIASDDPFDKAGAYAIQNQAFNPVQRITGCYTNVVGLPLCHLSELLLSLGLEIPDDPTRGCRTANGYNCQLVNQVRESNAK